MLVWFPNWPKWVFRQLFGSFFYRLLCFNVFEGSSAECGLGVLFGRSSGNLQLLTMISKKSRIPKSSFLVKWVIFNIIFIDFYIKIIIFFQVSKTEFDVGRFQIFLWKSRNTPTTFYKAWVTSYSVIAKKFVNLAQTR